MEEDSGKIRSQIKLRSFEILLRLTFINDCFSFKVKGGSDLAAIDWYEVWLVSV